MWAELFSLCVRGENPHANRSQKNAPPPPKDKLGTLVTPSANITAQTGHTQQDKCVFIQRQGQTADVCLVLENGSGLRRVSGLFAFFGMVEWNKARHHGAPRLRATAASSSAPPCWCLPSSRSWNCIVMDARVVWGGEGKGRGGEGKEGAGGGEELIVMETSVCLEVRHTVNVGGVLIALALPRVCACERCFCIQSLEGER